MEETLKYEAAMKELQQIVADMESGQLSLDVLTDKLKRAQELISLCKARLTQTEKEINTLLEKDKE